MKRYTLLLLMIVCSLCSYAGERDRFLGLQAGYVYKDAVAATIFMENETLYHNANEFYIDLYNGYDSDKFNSYQQFTIGYAYKYCIYRQKNSHLRMRMAAGAGADDNGFTCSLTVGPEYCVFIGKRFQISLSERNEYNFYSKRKWRAGAYVGIKFPF